MKIETYKCDVCGATKRETNHWWVVSVSPIKGHGVTFYLRPMSYDEGRSAECLHLCGQKCAVAKLSEVMGK